MPGSTVGPLAHSGSPLDSGIVDWLILRLRLLSSLPGGLLLQSVRGSLFFLFELLGSFLLKRRLPLRVVRPTGAAVSDRQLIVPGGVSGLKLHITLQRRNRFRKFSRGNIRTAEPEDCIGKARIQLCSARKMLDSLIPLLV